MAWYWLILGCLVSGSLGFLVCAIVFAAGESDDHMEAFSDQTIESILTNVTRSERRRQWRKSWNDMKREV